MLIHGPLASNAPRPASWFARLDLQSISARFNAVADDQLSPAAHHRVSLHNGQLTVDGRRIANPEFRPGLVTWSEKTAGHATSGCLHALAEGARLSGIITAGPDEFSATHAFVDLAPDDLIFDTQVQSGASATDWAPGPRLTLGVVVEAGLLYATATLDGQDVDASALPPSDTTGAVVDIALQPGSDLGGAKPPYPLPQSSRIVLSLDGLSFLGTMTSETGGTPIAWRGKAPAASTVHAMAAVTRPATTPLDLSLADLMSLTTVDANEILRTKFNELTVFGMQDEWRDKLLGAAKPALDPEVAAIFATYRPLFEDHIADPAILRQLADLSSDSGGPSDGIGTNDQRKLSYFFDMGIIKAQGFNECSAMLTQIAWERAKPRLRDYLQDPSSPSWAERLYTALTSPRGLTAMVLSYLGTGHDLTPINRTTDLLLALSPRADQPLLDKDGKPTGQKATWATLYHIKVISTLGLAGFERLNFPDEAEHQKEFAEYLATWFEKLLTDAANAVKDPSLQPATKAMYSQVQIELTEAAQLSGGLQNLAMEVTTGIAAAAGPASAPRNLIGKIQNWAKTSKFGQVFKKGIKIGAACYGLYTVISAFNNWGSLSDKEKAQTVILASELPVNLLELAADLDLPAVFPKIINFFRNSPDAAGLVERGLLEGVSEDEYFFNPMVRWVAPAIEDAASEGATLFTRLFGAESQFLKAFGVAAAAAAVGFNCYQIYEDRDESATIIALDSLQLVAGSMVLVGSVVALVAVDCAFAALGPIGAVCGVILMIVAMIIGRPKPQKPADKYMHDRGQPYLNGLIQPPADWVAPLKFIAA